MIFGITALMLFKVAQVFFSLPLRNYPYETECIIMLQFAFNRNKDNVIMRPKKRPLSHLRLSPAVSLEVSILWI